VSGLDPTLEAAKQELLAYATAAGYGPVITSEVRSYWKQKELYQRYIAGRAQLPAAPPGHSAHNWGLAFDMALAVPEYDDVGSVWRSWGGDWGGSRDPVHFELPGSTAWAARLSEAEIGAAMGESAVGWIGLNVAPYLLW
jgi:hypothetical protein